MGYHYLLSFRIGWSGVTYAKGGLKEESRLLSYAFPKYFENSNHLSAEYFRVISKGKEISYAKKTIRRGPRSSTHPHSHCHSSPSTNLSSLVHFQKRVFLYFPYILYICSLTSLKQDTLCFSWNCNPQCLKCTRMKSILFWMCGLQLWQQSVSIWTKCWKSTVLCRLWYKPWDKCVEFCKLCLSNDKWASGWSTGTACWVVHVSLQLCPLWLSDHKKLYWSPQVKLYSSFTNLALLKAFAQAAASVKHSPPPATLSGSAALLTSSSIGLCLVEIEYFPY